MQMTWWWWTYKYEFLHRLKKNILPKFLKKVGEETFLCRNILVESFSLENGHSWQRKTFVEAEDHQKRCLQIQDFEDKSFKYGSFYELLDVCLPLSSSPSFPAQ